MPPKAAPLPIALQLLVNDMDARTRAEQDADALLARAEYATRTDPAALITARGRDAKAIAAHESALAAERRAFVTRGEARHALNLATQEHDHHVHALRLRLHAPWRVKDALVDLDIAIATLDTVPAPTGEWSYDGAGEARKVLTDARRTIVNAAQGVGEPIAELSGFAAHAIAASKDAQTTARQVVVANMKAQEHAKATAWYRR